MEIYAEKYAEIYAEIYAEMYAEIYVEICFAQQRGRRVATGQAHMYVDK